jgi:hypothetical protein
MRLRKFLLFEANPKVWEIPIWIMDRQGIRGAFSTGPKPRISMGAAAIINALTRVVLNKDERKLITCSQERSLK